MDPNLGDINCLLLQIRRGAGGGVGEISPLMARGAYKRDDFKVYNYYK